VQQIEAIQQRRALEHARLLPPDCHERRLRPVVDAPAEHVHVGLSASAPGRLRAFVWRDRSARPSIS
jgi:hypothetical protein